MQAKEAIPSEEQRLSFEGRSLEDGHLLSDYGIGLDCLLHLLLSLKGGWGAERPMAFADLRKDKRGLKIGQWSKKAPKWRRASRGLCIEGMCSNDDCEAYDEKVVVSKGFAKFDLQVDGRPAEGAAMKSHSTCACPMCDEFIVPLTASFNNCYWRWDGVKEIQGGRQEVSAVEWQHTGNEYHCFDPKAVEKGGAGTAMWSRLMLEAVEDDPRSDCTLCNGLLTSRAQSQCGQCHHRFHLLCLDDWKAMCGKQMATSVPCPRCHADVPTTQKRDRDSDTTVETGAKRRSLALARTL